MNQNEKILKYIKKNGSITALEAVRHCGSLRLSARIKDLEEMGNIFHRKTISVRTSDGVKYVTEYSLIKEAAHG